MKIKDFKEANVVFASDQPEYQSLPALKLDGEEGIVVSCWKTSFMERLRVLFIGKVWVATMTFNESLQPLFLATKKSEIFKEDK